MVVFTVPLQLIGTHERALTILSRSGFEKSIRCVAASSLLCGVCCQPFDLGREQRNASRDVIDGQQRQILPDLVDDFLSRFVVFIVDGHASLLSFARL
jgi:hypothetical protein